MVSNSRILRLLVLAISIAGAVYLAANPFFSAIGILFAWGLWVAILSVLVERSRFVAGIAMLLLSALLLAIAFISTWVGIYGLLAFGHGSWLSLSGAGRIYA